MTTATEHLGQPPAADAVSLDRALDAIGLQRDMVALQAQAIDDPREEVKAAARNRLGELVIEGNLDPALGSALAQAEGRTEETVEDIMSVGGNAQMRADGEETVIERGTVTHVSQRKVRLFKRTKIGWRPTVVVSDNVEMLIGLGHRQRCGHCQRRDCQADGDVNGCTAREPRVFARCQVCPKRKKFWDTAPLEGFALDPAAEGVEPDPMEVRFADYEKVTPADRAKALLDDHMRAVHPSEARLLGLFRGEASRPVRRAQQPGPAPAEEEVPA